MSPGPLLLRSSELLGLRTLQGTPSAMAKTCTFWGPGPEKERSMRHSFWLDEDGSQWPTDHDWHISQAIPWGHMIPCQSFWFWIIDVIIVSNVIARINFNPQRCDPNHTWPSNEWRKPAIGEHCVTSKTSWLLTCLALMEVQPAWFGCLKFLCSHYPWP